MHARRVGLLFLAAAANVLDLPVDASYARRAHAYGRQGRLATAPWLPAILALLHAVLERSLKVRMIQCQYADIPYNIFRLLLIEEKDPTAPSVNDDK